LNLVDLGAVCEVASAVIDLAFISQESNLGQPVPSLLSPLVVCLVSGITSKTSTDLKESGIGDGLLVVVASV